MMFKAFISWFWFIVWSIHPRDLKCLQPHMCGSQTQEGKIFLIISRLPHKLHSRTWCVLQDNQLRDAKANGERKDLKIRAF